MEKMFGAGYDSPAIDGRFHVVKYSGNLTNNKPFHAVSKQGKTLLEGRDVVASFDTEAPAKRMVYELDKPSYEPVGEMAFRFGEVAKPINQINPIPFYAYYIDSLVR